MKKNNENVGSHNKLTFKAMAVILTVLIVVVLFVLVSSFKKNQEKKKAYNVNSLSAEQINNKIDSNSKKLMIVAHPDDDILWGGGHLMSGDYLVVCVTNGRNKARSNEFKKVIEASGNKPLILNYPDKILGKRADWDKVWNKIYSDLEKIIKKKHWDEIVVHNQDGEYGHIHHRNVHAIVTEIYDKNKIKSPLYCFGKYYKKSQIENVKNNLTPISEKEYKFKKKLADMYISQRKTIKKLWHMSKYEMWTKYIPNSESHNTRPSDDNRNKKYRYKISKEKNRGKVVDA